MSVNCLNNKEKFERELRLLRCTYEDGNIFDAVSDLKKHFCMYIDVKHEFYKDGVNILVQVLCVVDGEYVNELCSSGYGDNGEIDDEYEAYEWGMDTAFRMLENYKINNKAWK